MHQSRKEVELQLASFSSIFKLQKKLEGILHSFLNFKEKLKGFYTHCWTSKKIWRDFASIDEL
jgi:hypothetical protein